MSGRAAGPANEFRKFLKEEIEQSIPDRFEQQVWKYPDRIAVKTQDNPVTYSSINKLSNRFAHAILEERGEGEEPVALLLEKSASMVAAILAVLKAGKFYLALDRIYPAARNLHMLEDSGARLIVTDKKNYQQSMEWAAQVRSVINIDDLSADFSIENVSLKLSPDTLACIFYTSGSTGSPKGVVDNHLNVLHNIMRYTNTLNICSEDRLTLVQSFCFSGSVSSLFGALLNGAAVCLFNLHEEGIDNLADWMVREDVTIYHSVPVIFQYLMAQTRKFPGLRLIRLEGDQVSKKHVELYKEKINNDCILVNGLGATETGLSRQYFINTETVIPENVVPIGYAVEDMEVLLLDDNDEEVETGKVGEIAVKSRYIAKGYWRKPELTEAAFKEDPQNRAMRIYRTGDMGRFLPDRCLEYRGRRDFQVKIRGQWVEIEAIEDALKHLAGIGDAVVWARDDHIGDKHLVAYLVPDSVPHPSISNLRQAVGEQFPEHMVPSRYMFIDELPITHDGKLDRLALPVPDQLRHELDAKYAAPHTQTEKTLAEIWREVLNIEQIGIHDDFLELGGDSIMAWQIVSRIRNAFKVEIPLRDIFEQPTIAGQATCIDNILKKSGKKQPPV